MTPTPSWDLELPPGVFGRAVDPPSDSPYATMAIYRGWLEDRAPVTVTVSTSIERGVHLREHVRRLSTHARDGPQEGEETEVPGARGARRLDTTIELEDNLEPGVHDEALTIVAARAHGDEVVLLTVRTLPADGVQPQVDQVVAGFRLRARER